MNRFLQILIHGPILLAIGLTFDFIVKTPLNIISNLIIVVIVMLGELVYVLATRKRSREENS